MKIKEGFGTRVEVINFFRKNKSYVISTSLIALNLVIKAGVPARQALVPCHLYKLIPGHLLVSWMDGINSVGYNNWRDFLMFLTSPIRSVSAGWMSQQSARRVCPTNQIGFSSPHSSA
jgi:hypothetical protein